MAKAKKPGPENVEVSAEKKVEAPVSVEVKVESDPKHSDDHLAKHPKFAKFNSHGGK